MKEMSIYIVLTQSGAMFSRALKLFTRAPYNHVSISLTPTLERMYSFARLQPYNPFKAGFVEEGIHIGTFKRFYKTQAMVMELKVDAQTYMRVKHMIDFFCEHKYRFRYNYRGVFLACFKKDYAPKNNFYCSQFVRSCLALFDISNANNLPKIIKPIDFLKLDNTEVIYEGQLQQYSY